MKLRVTTTVAMLILGIAIPSYASEPIDIAHGQLNFGADSGSIQTVAIGTAAGVGFTHRYSNVFAGVDALLTVVDINNLDSDGDETNGVNNLFDVDDISNSGEEIDIDIDVPVTLGAGSAILRADFVLTGTNTPVALQNISIRVADIDSNQYVTFSGINAYELSSTPPTELSVSSSLGAYEFKEPSGNSSSSSDEENWALVEYASAESISWTVGAREAGRARFGVSFADATWTEGPTRTTPALSVFNVDYSINNADSGAAPTTQSSTVNSSTVTLVAEQGNLLKSNCTLDGWNTRSDGTGANYQTGDSITLTSNTTLYAIWVCTVAPSPGSPQVEAPTAVQAVNSVPTLAKTGASEFRAIFAIGLVGIGALMIAYVRRPVKS